MFTAYFFQDVFQNYHDEIVEKNQDININCRFNKNYRADFFLRSFHTYIMSIGYVAQEVTYWDMYDVLTEGVPFYTFAILSVIFLLVYRYVLKNSIMILARDRPFFLTPDAYYGNYFQQSKLLKHKNVRAN